MAKSPEEAMQSMIANMKQNTGKTLEEWVVIGKASGLKKHGQLVSILKTEYGIGHGFANLVAHKTLESDAGSIAESTDLLAQQYSGEKAGLRPLYDKLAAAIRGLGPDVEFSPKKAYVSLRRNKQFGLIQPTTKTRLDLGLILPGTSPGGRLEVSGSFNAMCSHRVKLSDAEDVDEELLEWLREAYEAS